jgi:hypothetical protein
MSLEMAHKVIFPAKKNYIPQFLKQRDINSYNGEWLASCRRWGVRFQSARSYTYQGMADQLEEMGGEFPVSHAYTYRRVADRLEETRWGRIIQ